MDKETFEERMYTMIRLIDCAIEFGKLNGISVYISRLLDTNPASISCFIEKELMDKIDQFYEKKLEKIDDEKDEEVKLSQKILTEGFLKLKMENERLKRTIETYMDERLKELDDYFKKSFNSFQ